MTPKKNSLVEMRYRQGREMIKKQIIDRVHSENVFKGAFSRPVFVGTGYRDEPTELGKKVEEQAQKVEALIGRRQPGCYDDHAVQTAIDQLQQAGWDVAKAKARSAPKPERLKL